MYFMGRATSLSHCRLNMHAGHACTTRNHECMSDDGANNVIGRPGGKKRKRCSANSVPTRPRGRGEDFRSRDSQKHVYMLNIHNMCNEINCYGDRTRVHDVRDSLQIPIKLAMSFRCRKLARKLTTNTNSTKLYQFTLFCRQFSCQSGSGVIFLGTRISPESRIAPALIPQRLADYPVSTVNSDEFYRLSLV